MFALMLQVFAIGKREEQNMSQVQGIQDDGLRPCPSSVGGVMED